MTAAWQILADYAAAFSGPVAAAQSLGLARSTVAKAISRKRKRILRSTLERIRERNPVLAEALEPCVMGNCNPNYLTCEPGECENYETCRALVAADDGQPVRCEKGDEVV